MAVLGLIYGRLCLSEGKRNVWNYWHWNKPKSCFTCTHSFTKYFDGDRVPNLPYVNMCVFVCKRRAHELSKLNWNPFILMLHYRQIFISDQVGKGEIAQQISTHKKKRRKMLTQSLSKMKWVNIYRCRCTFVGTRLTFSVIKTGKIYIRQLH